MPLPSQAEEIWAGLDEILDEIYALLSQIKDGHNCVAGDAFVCGKRLYKDDTAPQRDVEIVDKYRSNDLTFETQTEAANDYAISDATRL